MNVKSEQRKTVCFFAAFSFLPGSRSQSAREAGLTRRKAHRKSRGFSEKQTGLFFGKSPAFAAGKQR